MIRLDARSSREIRAVLLAIRQAEPAIKKQIRQQSKAVIGPAWGEVMNSNASTPLERRVLASTARVTVSDRNIRLSSATGGRKLRGGLTPGEGFGAVEFGSNRTATATYTQRSRRGKPYRVTRHTQRQFRPFNRKGYVFYPAVAEITPRAMSLMVQTTVRVLAEALEGKSDG